METEYNDSQALNRLQQAIDHQRRYLAAYEKPAEPLAFETLRTFDDLFCRDLMQPKRKVDRSERLFRSLSSWGVNHALQRIIPRVPAESDFRDFPSHDTIQAQADDFVFHCGVLARAERLEGWLREGLLRAKLRVHPPTRPGGITEVLALRSAVPSYLDEEIGLAGLRWASDRVTTQDRPWERRLEKRHKELSLELERRVVLADGWRTSYLSSREIDEYFMEWARLYLRRIFSQDMIAPEGSIGGRPFSRYLEVLSALSARSQKQIAFAAILLARHPSAHIRNLLTTHMRREWFLESLALDIDGDKAEMAAISESFILSGANLDVHTKGGAAWAPIVQASAGELLLPVYGLDINPFLFLLTDLRSRYEADWFRIANNRERRWIEELEMLFGAPRWRTHGQNLRLRRDGRELTDIDFAAFCVETNELALFQLKWQHPVGMDNRGRRSAGKNLIQDGNRWIEKLTSWLEQFGTDELMRRLGFEFSASPRVHLFVLGRYYVHLTGFDQRDTRAIWSDWAHFQRVLAESPNGVSVSDIASRLHSTLTRSRAKKIGENTMFPVGDLAVVINPTSEPDDALPPR